MKNIPISNEKYKIITIDEAKKIIPEILTEPMYRKALVEKGVKKYINDKKLPAELLKDHHPKHFYNKTKCRFGNAVSALINAKTLTQDEQSTVWYDDNFADKGVKNNAENVEATIENAKQVIQRDDTINRAILDLLDGKQFSRKELLDKVVSVLKSDSDFVKAAKLGKKNFVTVIKADAGRLLNAAVESGEIVLKSNVYSLPVAETLEERNQRLFKAIDDHGVLLNQTLAMLKMWYESKGYTVEYAKDTDASNDGGIDGVIKCKDGMDYPHKIILQIKCFEKIGKLAREKDVREFCGVTAADNEATMGLFVVNGRYDQNTKNLVKNFKVKYFKLIDGKLWLKLADECGYDLGYDLGCEGV